MAWSRLVDAQPLTVHAGLPGGPGRPQQPLPAGAAAQEAPEAPGRGVQLQRARGGWAPLPLCWWQAVQNKAQTAAGRGPLSELPGAKTRLVKGASALPAGPSPAVPRRQLFGAAAAAAAVLSLPQGAQAKSKDYMQWNDRQDGYTFAYPFGWQEVSVKGQDIVFKDVIEPLESVSVAMSPTDKESITEFGSPGEVAVTLAEKVLTSPKQDTKVLAFKEAEKDGQLYYEFEFASKSPTFIRHALAVVAVKNGKFYTLTTGANEKRWNKIKPRLQEVVQSFAVQPIIPTG